MSIVVSAVIVLVYITLGGLTGAIYGEVLQFFVIIAGLVPVYGWFDEKARRA